MPAPLEKQAYIKNELPYELLKALYDNSRLLLLEKAIITDTLIGYLPLHIDSFEVWKKELKLE